MQEPVTIHAKRSMIPIATCSSIQSWLLSPIIQFVQQVWYLYIVMKTKLKIFCKWKKKNLILPRMWLLVLAPALLGSLTRAENDETDISGCCTHLAVTRWSCWLLGWWWELERIWGSNHGDYNDDFNDEHDVVALQRGQCQRAPGKPTWGVQADRGPRGQADLQERGEGRVSFLSQGEQILKL